MKSKRRKGRSTFEVLESRALFSAALAALPSPWKDSDIGAVGKAGSAAIDASGNTVVSGGGADVWGSADAFNYAYQPLSGDGSVIARVTAETNTNGWAKGGVMIRTDLSTGSPFAFLFVSPSNGISFQARATAKATPSSHSIAGAAPRWLELVRSGQTVSAFSSTDDINWTAQGSVTLPAGANVYAGLAVCAHNNAAVCTTMFSSATVTLANPTAPAAPLNLAVSAKSSSDIHLSWSAADALASSFVIERQGPGDVGFVPLATVASTTFTYEDTAVAPSSAYSYEVVAANAVGQSAASVPESATTPSLPIAPAMPGDFSATAVSAADVHLQWIAGDSLATSFVIQRQGPNDAAFIPLTTVAGSATSFDDTTVTQNSTYSYEIVAVNAAGTSDASDPSTATTPIILPPAAPTDVAASAISSGDIRLNWTAGDSLATSFIIQRQGPADATFVTLKTVPFGTISFDDTSVLPSTAYVYQILAMNAGGSSVSSATASATTPAAPVNNWNNTNIGAVGIAGTTTVSNGITAVSASGTDIWSTADIFNFDNQNFVGNGTIVARMLNNSTTNSGSKAGIMLRETNAVDSRFVSLVIKPSHTIEFDYRSATHNNSNYVATTGTVGTWLKLTRLGSTFTGEYSSDGVTWKPLGSVSIPMVNNIQAGLAVCSHNNAQLATAKFDNIAVTADGGSASIWSNPATPPLARWESASVTYNNKLYIFGGFTDRSLDATAEVDVYDPATNQWSFVTTIPTGAMTHAGATVVGNTLYLAGGDLGTFKYGKTLTATSQVLTYNFDTNIWGTIASTPKPVSCGGFVAIDNVLYYFGGINPTDTADVSDTYAFDLDNPSAGWVTKAAMPNARNHIGYAAINGIAYAVGGQHLYNAVKGNDAEVDAYNPVTNSWSKVASLPQPWSSFHVSTIVVNDKIVILGGQTNGGYDGIYQTGIEEFDPAANTWSKMGTLPEANEGLAAAYINGQLLAVGGTVDNLGGWALQQTWSTTAIVL